MQLHKRLLLPQAYLSNFHNRVRNEEAIPLCSVVQQTSRAHKRAKIVNYTEVDIADPFDEAENDGFDVDMDGKGDYDTGDVGSQPGSPTTEGDENGGTNSTNGGTNATVHEETLPDLVDQPELLNIIKYPHIKETFMQSTVATPYRLNLPQSTVVAGTSGTNAQCHNEEPIIIPIHFEIEDNGTIYNDFFTWNLNDISLTPEEFASVYCADLNPTGHDDMSSLHQQVVSTIKEHIEEYEKVAAVKLPDFHAIINLTCNLNDKFYDDNFQWNLSDTMFTPEMFAEIVVADLGLTRDFLPLLCYSLYDSVTKIKKEWLDGNLSLGDTTLLNDAAFGYLSGIRLDIDGLGINWCPKVEILTPQEIQKREIEKERNLRRLKRESDRLTRRGRRRLDDLETTLRI
ncbi:similar to Saccharomyces cerevisiae YLR321C SFH1 Component of the RSC chromatin remodeling complex [Maudiozyma saulgeensis]|uniref:Chromatin structure-remodeling complex subunit SFH1 n=1 Tax=Maudiozyma saulgeensis TaxID=1789683 RepID=A0A1X7RBM8_9SACH|nr:similar to Saccharomyces cerevisiae YLR321C SFH1 Component of the RSC chromatin remodeling complex [Kazachstania saulgeensis]